MVNDEEIALKGQHYHSPGWNANKTRGYGTPDLYTLKG